MASSYYSSPISGRKNTGTSNALYDRGSALCWRMRSELPRRRSPSGSGDRELRSDPAAYAPDWDWGFCLLLICKVSIQCSMALPICRTRCRKKKAEFARAFPWRCREIHVNRPQPSTAMQCIVSIHLNRVSCMFDKIYPWLGDASKETSSPSTGV
jgi:hypothetical protein